MTLIENNDGKMVEMVRLFNIFRDSIQQFNVKLFFFIQNRFCPVHRKRNDNVGYMSPNHRYRRIPMKKSTNNGIVHK